MAPPNLSQQTNVVLKLHLADKGETRRIALRKLWNSDIETVSFQHLVDLALQYSGCEDERVSKVCITYTDEDGDIITISSDEELAEAFEQFVHKVPPVVRATAKVKLARTGGEKPANVVNPAWVVQEKRKQRQALQMKRQQMKMQKMGRQNLRAERAKERQQQEAEKSRENKIEYSEKEVENPLRRSLLMATAVKPSTVEPSAVKPCPVKPTTAEVPKAEPTQHRPKIPSSFNPNFIHGRHTCDGCFTTPIIGYRFNATNRPDYDLCNNCFKNYKGDEIRFLPEQLDRDVHLQQRWHNRQNRRQKRAACKRQEAAKACGRTIPAHDQTTDNFSKSALNEAIRRSLQNAEEKKTETENVPPLAPMEKIESKVDEEKHQSKPKAASIPSKKQPEESLKDLIQGMFDDPLEKPATAAALTMAKHFAELLKKQKAAASAPTTVVPSGSTAESASNNDENTIEKPSDVEANDAVTDEPEIEVPKDEVKVEDVPAEEEAQGEASQVEDPPVEDIVVEDASVEEAEVKPPASTTTISIEPIDSLVLEIEKPQLDRVPSTVSDDAISYDNQSGEMILDGDDDISEASKSEAGSSNGGWQVVDEEGQNVTDEMVAQAAQMLGSALFESDANVASTNDNNDASNSFVSGLTSVPSITTTKSEISPVLLNRWEHELRQLHELGFLDDHANVEAFGHLEAANMGVGSDDVITVEKVVNFLLNQ
eukprot:CAMPEP_0204614640 /NCGR_PEP_ID=MMETSP0717-20131115/2306_1 /ASSEMBLY_ACC=CAM_ASM_000666 /TAXON_ID=230516 /ORGANISM="Chaetoceros curvisetus" /LENGTH=710 /DNA_ID=CAMNT_0051627353 /DNA_START=6 /DNA_END=2138 /DNA_ORIENTATION=+